MNLGDHTKVILVERVCKYIENRQQLPSLAELASQFSLSSHHLQKTFKGIVGISPHQYADEFRLQRLKRKLKNGKSVTAALYEAGYNSSSVVYERASKQLGMTPVNYRSGAHKLNISYSTANCPLGVLLVARTEKGICAVSLADSPKPLLDWLGTEFPKAIIVPDVNGLKHDVAQILQYLKGKQPHCNLPLDLRATAFQRRVFEELRRIPYGQTRSYSDIAASLGSPSASRAVARACASNLVSLLVPCHRVIRKTGNLGGYRWGLNRKAALLKLEKTRIRNATSK